MEPCSKKLKSEQKIKYVYHIADIHIHYKNYDHIKYAWKQLIANIKTDESVLVIAGDIFDHKTYLKAEDIQLFNDMMNDLEINKIHCFMIPGNHDYNNNLLGNKENGDMINALVRKVNYKYVHYFSLSQVYKFHNILFYLHSPIDLKVLDRIDDPSSIHIAVLHEAIQGSKTTNGYTFDTCRFSPIDLSNKFDMTLMGDIHTMQLLQPNVGYSGSFVQKNKTEDLLKGYLLWSIECPPVFMPLHQLSVWFKVIIENDQVQSSLPSEMNIKIRGLQLHHKNCSETFISYYKDFLEARYHCRIDGIYNNDILIDTSASSASIMPVTVNEIEVTILDSLASNTNKDRIMNIHSSLFEKTSGAPSVNWKIKFMSWSGIRKYSKKISYINFDDLSVLTSLIGNNEIGKSTVFDILIILLFNNASHKKHIINKTETEAWAKCVIEVGFNDIYLIERTWSGSENQTKVKLSLNGEDITKTTLYETYKFLESNVTGSFVVFKDVIIALQERKSMVNLPKNEVYDLFCRIMDLERLKVAEKENHSLMLKCKKDYVKYQQQGCGNEQLINLQFQRSQLEEKYNELKKDSENKGHKLQQLNEEIKKLQPIAFSCPYSIEFITTKVNELDSYKDFPLSHYELLKNELSHKTSIIKEQEKIKSSLIDSDDDDDDDSDICLFDEGTDYLKEFTLMTTKYEKLSKDYVQADLILEFNVNCHCCLCNQEKLGVTVDKQVIKNEMNSIEITLNRLKTKLEFANRGFNPKQLSELKKEVIFLQDRINDHLPNFIKNEEYHKWYALIENAEIASKAKIELDLLQENAKLLSPYNQTQLESLLIEKIQIENKIQLLLKNNEEALKYEVEYKDREIYDKLINSKNGIPFKMIESITKKVEINSNLIFASIANFKIQIKYTHKGIKLFIIESRGPTQITIPAQQGSGYDKFIIDIILRHVLCSLVSAGLPSMLFIDEGFGSADENNFQIICSQVLPVLSKHFNRIIVVSHLVNIHDYTQTSIEIVKDENNNSNLIFGSVPDEKWVSSTILEQKKNFIQTKKIEKTGKRKEVDDIHIEMIDENRCRCLLCKKDFNISYSSMHKKSKIHEKNLGLIGFNL